MAEPPSLDAETRPRRFERASGIVRGNSAVAGSGGNATAAWQVVGDSVE